MFQSDFSLVKTGFGRNSKSLLSYLYSTGKYEIIHYCVGMNEATPDLKRTPWKSIGTLPASPEKQQEINRDPQISKNAHYGAYYLDEVIKREKPDVYIAVQDIWGVDFAIGKHWFNKISSAIWTTLDSLPLLPSALQAAPKIKNYWIWSDFATKEMHRLGHSHVKTVHGIIDTQYFSRLSDTHRDTLRQKNNIDKSAYVIGFVFRNQLRKSIPNLIEGFKIFRKNNPDITNSKLLLHTDLREGWDLKRLTEEHNIKWEDILTTHICANCLKYDVKPYNGPNQSCRFCSSPNGVNTTGVALGISEPELNEIYNLMDVYCHPFTSGGQEIPIQEAKLSELITLVTDYSCGEEMCQKAANSLNLNWSEYREFGTNFIKASTDPKHIATRLEEVYRMDPLKKTKMGKAARNWTLANFSVKSVGSKIEKFLDSCPFVDVDNFPKLEIKDSKAIIPPTPDTGEWIKALYKKILKTDVNEKDEGFLYWMSEIKKGAQRQVIEDYFRGVAAKEVSEKNSKQLIDKLDKGDQGRRILYAMPLGEIDIYVSTALFSSIKNLYPDHNLYVAINPIFESMLVGNDNVHKVLEFTPEMDEPSKLKDAKGTDLFDVAYTPHLNKNNHLYIKKTIKCN